MNKIRLDLDSLSVDSFPTGDDSPEARGTVKAHEAKTQEPAHTCFYTCGSNPFICCTG
jgi:hypothetical protein